VEAANVVHAVGTLRVGCRRQAAHQQRRGYRKFHVHLSAAHQRGLPNNGHLSYALNWRLQSLTLLAELNKEM
jgi:hypothetical protein